MHHVVIHGHFYQPPREEPWLEMVPREPTAAPDRDWNHRITRECYAPLAHGRLLSDDGRIRGVLNTYGWLSFDVGPTLVRWFERHDPAVLGRIVAGDREMLARTGHGAAIAAPYHHTILPLASLRDKRTEVNWGLREFRRVFGRDAKGMWLPETAVDDETLQVLAEAGVQFTILAPHQVSNPSVSGRPLTWRGANGHSLKLCVYDGGLAHGVAFGGLLKDATEFAEQLARRTAPGDDGPSIRGLATDGETFGHHHRFGDLALAATIDLLRRDMSLTVTSFEAVALTMLPESDTSIVAESSWSCSHGVERWRDNCGCRMDAATDQSWRGPLRTGLEALTIGIHSVVEQEWPPSAGDLTLARDEAGPDLKGRPDLDVTALRLLEAERHALATFTSCAWFFDDLARIEVRQVLRHAARSLEFLPPGDAALLRQSLLISLRSIRSNDPSEGDGETIWHRDVLAEADGPARLAAGLAAIRELSPDALIELDLPTHSWELDGDDIVTIHRRTGTRFAWGVQPVVHGIVASRIHCVRRDQPDSPILVSMARIPLAIRRVLKDVAGPFIYDALLSAPDRERLAAGSLSPDEARAAAFRTAWQIVTRDGLAAADVLLHAVIDLYQLDEAAFSDLQLAESFEKLSVLPASHARLLLVERMGLNLSALS
jgi:hypothetical protein